MAADDELVLNYLREQNRPYSSNDILQNLRHAVGKTSLLRHLDELVARGDIVEKVYGKQKIYYFNQQRLTDLTPDQMAEIERQCAELETRCQSKRQETRNLQAQLDALEKQLSVNECSTRLQSLKDEIAELNRQIDLLRTSAAKHGDVSCRQKIIETKQRNEAELKRRRQITKDIIGRLLDGGYPGTLEDLCEEVGLEIV